MSRAPGQGDDFGTIALAGVETLNIDATSRCKDFDMLDGDLTDGIDPSFITSTITLAGDAFETLNISGLTGLTVLGDHEALFTVETVDAADLAGDFSIDLTGNENDVTVTAGDGDNSITGGLGDDSITSGVGYNTIDGGAGDDSITVGAAGLIDGGDGNDSITVGDGGSVITGGAGLDTIALGSGVTEDDVDTIVFGDVTDSQGTTVDVISGFQVDVQSTDDINADEVVDELDIINDVLDFTAIGEGVYAGEANGYGAVLTSLALGAANAVLDTSTSTLYFDVDASGTLDDADMAIQLTGVTDLSEANFAWAEVAD